MHGSRLSHAVDADRPGCRRRGHAHEIDPGGSIRVVTIAPVPLEPVLTRCKLPVPQHLDSSPESVDHFYTDMLRLGLTERHRGPIAEWIALDHAQMERVARRRDGFAHFAARAAPLGQPAGRHRSRTDEAP